MDENKSKQEAAPIANSEVSSAGGHNGAAADGERDGGPALLPEAPPQPLLPPPGEWKPGTPPGGAGGGQPPVSRKSGWRFVWLLLIALLAIGAFYFWSRRNQGASQPGSAAHSGKGGKGGDVTANVVADRATLGNIGVYYTGLGAVTPIYTVTVKSRVNGELMNVYYKEGDMVKKDDLLALIDPRPYEAALTQAEGALVRDQATLENAKIDLARYQLLIKTNAIPQQQLATQEATVKQDEGIVKADEGAVASARVNVIYTKITSPITGRVGLRLVDPGNIVQSTDSTGLAVITQMDPISVIFTISEDQLQPVYQRMRAGQKLEVDAWDRDLTKRIAQGTLATIDNQIDQTTGTVRLRADFSNPNQALFPNQFVNAHLLVQEKRGVMLIPNAAIQRTSTATFAYVVQPDSTVAVRNITIGTTEGDNSEVTSGLKAGEIVVTAGADKLEQGSKVHVTMQGAEQGPPSEAAPGASTPPQSKSTSSRNKSTTSRGKSTTPSALRGTGAPK